MTANAQQQVAIVRLRPGSRTPDRERAPPEEPLEIRIHDRPFAVIMRTPGADRELAAGFLLAERVLRSSDDLGTIAHCTDRDATGNPAENIVNVTLANGPGASLEQAMADRRIGSGEVFAPEPIAHHDHALALVFGADQPAALRVHPQHVEEA